MKIKKIIIRQHTSIINAALKGALLILEGIDLVFLYLLPKINYLHQFKILKIGEN